MTGLEIALSVIATGFGYLLFRHVREFRKLRLWAAQARLGAAPEAAGAWGVVFNRLHRHRGEMRKRRRELVQNIVRSRRAAQALPYGVTLLGADMRLDWCNEAARAHLGLDAQRDRGQPIGNFVRSPEFVEYLREGDFSKPVQLRTGGGDLRTLALQFVDYGNEERLLLSQDVTGAEQLEAMRRDFVANVSHELRTPLTVLSGFLETIQDLDLDPQRVRDYVDLMAPQALRMRRLIDDLLTLSALEHANAPPRDERVRVRPLLERVLSEAEGVSAGRHEISLQISAECDLMGAESEIASAFGNLLTNAVRYTPERGVIKLFWRGGQEGAQFSVEDSGIGIEAEHLPRLTERFYRVDRSRSRETGGTGLGLSIVKHVLARHQAVLKIESTPGKGSCFSARFPAARMIVADAKVVDSLPSSG